jgi:repressor LexA
MKPIKTFQERLQEALQIRNMKPVELHEKTNISESLISKYLSGNAIARQRKIALISEALNVNPVWLMGYDVPMEDHEIESNVFPISDIPKKVPVVGKISAGLPILATENIEGYEFAPSSQIKEGYTYFYLRVQGDSMNLKFNEGDIVLVQKQDDLENNEIGVILVNGFDATVKKYRKENGLVILEPMSTNPENTVQIYNPKDISIKVIGKVISYQGKI